MQVDLKKHEYHTMQIGRNEKQQPLILLARGISPNSSEKNQLYA